MALGDEGYYALDGTYVDRNVLVQYMINYYNEKYPDTQITDFNEGSEIRNLLESIAVDIFHLELDDQQILTAAFLSTSYGSYLDLFGEELNTPRKQGLQSQGTVTFSINEAVNYLITIPQYTTLVSSATGLYYHTIITVEIPIGETSVDCPCYSVVPGAGTNAEAGTIDLFEDENTFNGINVTNSEAFTGGRSTETDEDYRNRLLEIKRQDSFGSKEYYNRIGTEVSGVHDIAIVSSTNNYTGKVLVNGYTKPLPSSVLSEVTSVFTDEQNLVYNQTFEVEEVDYTTLNLEITCVVLDEVEDQQIIDAIQTYIDGGTRTIANTEITYNGVNINQPITNYVLLTVLEYLPFIVQVTNLTSDEETFNKLTPDTNTVFKLGTVTITQEVAE